jgi:predicted transcriptional regulator
MTFQDLQYALVAEIRERVRSGELTERGLARLTGISQPHIHNVLKGKRLPSLAVMDRLMARLFLDVRTLVRILEDHGYERRE